MRIRIYPSILVLSLLAVISTACSVALADRYPGPALAPQLTQSARAATTSVPIAPAPAPAAAPGLGEFVSLSPTTRTSSEGSVTVEVTPGGGAAGTLIFDVTMNTHSVELDYDMVQIATLRDNQGRVYPFKSWNGESGGHHRQGALTFATPTGAAPKWLELDLSGIDGIPNRLFRWDVN